MGKKKRKRSRSRRRRSAPRRTISGPPGLEEAADIDPEDIPKELDRIERICRRAVELHERGEDRRALAEINKAIASPVMADKPYYVKGIIAGELGQYRESAHCLKVFLTFHPDDPEALFNYASAVRNMGYLDYALEVYDQVLRRNPEPALKKRAQKVRQDTLMIKEMLAAGHQVAFAPDELPLRPKKGKPPADLLVGV